VYIFGDGTTQTEQRLTAYGEEIDKLTPNSTQVIYLDPRRGDGLQVAQFYSLRTFPCILVVMDDDTLYQHWELQLPMPDQVSYVLSQINGSMH